jgi:hypothetical protein
VNGSFLLGIIPQPSCTTETPMNTLPMEMM